MSPFESAWLLLKRQTELGEFHPWLPSSLGPVAGYHGTSTDFARGIHEKGLLPGNRQAATGRTDYTPEGEVATEENIIDPSIPPAAFFSPSKNAAEMHGFFAQNALRAQPGGSGGASAMVGIRRGLADAIRNKEINPLTGQPYQVVPMKESHGINEGAIAIAGGIPRKFITPVLPDMLFGHSQEEIEDNLTSPYKQYYQQPTPLDWSGYDRFNQDQNFPDMV